MPNRLVDSARRTLHLLSFPFRAKRVLNARFNRIDETQEAVLKGLGEISQQLSRLVGPPDPLAERFGRLQMDKRALVDFACGELGIRSIADLAGAWCDPPGGYSLYAMEKYQVPTAYLADIYMPEELVAEAKNHPGFHLLYGGAGSPEVAEQIPAVDAVFLFDILYLCVKPDWDEILEMYAGRTKWFFISNIVFPDFDRTVRLFDLGEDQYFDCVPYTRETPGTVDLFAKLDEPHPEDPTRTYRDFTHFFQWGMTDGDLIGKLRSLGFDLYFLKTIFKRADIKKNAWSRLFAFMKAR